MAIYLNDPELEERLERLGKMQPVSVTKHAMLRAIVEESTKDLRRPNAWRRAQPAAKKNGRTERSPNNRRGVAAA